MYPCLMKIENGLTGVLLILNYIVIGSVLNLTDCGVHSMVHKYYTCGK